jgi:hypothetical protein
MELTRALRCLVAGWLAPSEQINFLVVYGDKVKDDRQYWIDQASNSLGIDEEKFNEVVDSTPAEPSNRYLQLYAQAGFADYGATRYIDILRDIDRLFIHAMMLDDVNLLKHLKQEAIPEDSDMDKVIAYLKPREDYRKYLPFLPLHKDDLVELEIRQAVLKNDQKGLRALFAEGDRKIDEHLICAVYEEAIERKDVKMIEFISSNIVRPMEEQLFEALDSSNEVFEVIINDDDELDEDTMLNLHKQALKENLLEKADIIQEWLDEYAGMEE